MGLDGDAAFIKDKSLVQGSVTEEFSDKDTLEKLESELGTLNDQKGVHYKEITADISEADKEKNIKINSLMQQLYEWMNKDQNAMLSDPKAFPYAQRSSWNKRSEEIEKINKEQLGIDTLNARVKNQIDWGKRLEDILKTKEFKKWLYCDFAWYREEELDLDAIDIIYDAKWKWIVINCTSKYEEALVIPRDTTREKATGIIENQWFIKEIEAIWLTVLGQMSDPSQLKQLQAQAMAEMSQQKEGPQNMEEIMKKIVRDKVKNIYGKKMTTQQEIYLANLTTFGWWAIHRTIDVIDGKDINIGIDEAIKINWLPVVTMQSVEFTKKMCELHDMFSRKVSWSTFKSMYDWVFDHEFQHQHTNDFMAKFLQENKDNPSKLPENAFEAHLFFSTKNELISFLWNHYDKEGNIDFDAIEKDITKEWIGRTHSYPWQFTDTTPEILQIYKDKVHEYIGFMKHIFEKKYPSNNGKYKPEVGFIDQLTAEFITWPEAPSFKLSQQERMLIAEFGKKKLNKSG